MWVVEPSGPPERAQEARDELRVVEAGEELRRALALGALHHLDHLGQGGRSRRGVEQCQRVRDQNPAGRWRGIGEHVAAPIGDAQRLAGDGHVGGEVLAAEQTAPLGHPVDDRGPDVAGVERLRSLGPQALEGVGQLGLTQRLPGAQEFAGGGEQRRRLRGRGDDPGEDLDDVRLLHVELDAVARQRRRRRDEALERDPAEAARGLADPGRHAEGADRCGADVELLDRVTERDADGDQRRPWCRAGRLAPRSLDEEVQQRRRLTGRHDQHVAAGAEAGQQRLAGKRREHRSQRGVDGVAALSEHVGSGARADGMPGGDHPELIGLDHDVTMSGQARAERNDMHDIHVIRSSRPRATPPRRAGASRRAGQLAAPRPGAAPRPWPAASRPSGGA